MKTPKIIHFCWFGGKPYPKSVKKCIQSWKKYCPDYQIIKWDETRITDCDNIFLTQAIQNKKWAFASDYIRLKALNEYGGIYLDTDVELIGSLDEYTDNEVFLGFEKHDRIGTAVIGSIQGHWFIQLLLEEYSDKSLLLPSGELDLTPNVIYFTRELIRRGLAADNSLQVIDGIAVYPCEVFSPKSLDTGRINITPNTCAIHHFKASWLPLKNRINTRVAWVLGPKLTQKIKKALGKRDDSANG